ncbi:long-chain fatty acid transporter [Rhizobium anhuiense]|uniref:OmpP1/FadL family transporter n=1 Tax=Rhizobium anhuiense TaxID=1184720 RepID=UPI000BE8D84C|nr:outer membrane protein transport protein [Rhizobium anhuiense]PDS59970.1 long-chain fatty acid transporter [Rhizobium anhuiense]
MNTDAMQLTQKLVLTTALAVLCAAAPALAGGYSRGDANIDILFNDSRFSATSELIYVSPGRHYSELMGQSVDEKSYSDDFYIPSLAIGAKFGDNFSCALTYTQPFGGSATYSDAAQNAEFVTAASLGDPFPNPTSRMKFSADEYGATCKVAFAAGPGNLHLIGGAFLETFDYREDTWIGSVHLKDDGELGYRVGVAYDIPEYAMRVQVMYRSEVHHEGTGAYTPSDFAIANGITDSLPANGAGILPQSLKIYAQTGVAPGWLVYGSVTWTDWSVLPQFTYDVPGLGTANKIFNYEDGYTIQVGAGHEFSDKISGTMNITWDQGVGSGADITTDTWTLGVGAQYKAEIGTFGIGAAVSYLTAGSQAVSSGATYDAKADADWALGIGISYAVQF